MDNANVMCIHGKYFYLEDNKVYEWLDLTQEWKEYNREASDYYLIYYVLKERSL